MVINHLLPVSVLLFVPANAIAQMSHLPDEPVRIGTQPQFFVDDYIVDNRFALKYKREAVVRVFHPPKKHAANPLIANDGGYVCVRRDPKSGLFRMWYQISRPRREAAGKRAGSEYAIAYAESKDGIHWKRPKLGLLDWNGGKQNNVVWRGITGKRASGPCLLELPEKDRRGYRYVMSYRTAGAGRGNSGIRLVGSQDGIHWDKKSDTLIAELHSDTLNSLVFDPSRKRYLMYCRAKHIYRTFKGPIRDTGASRRVAVMISDTLWTRWKSQPRNILIPDELDSAKRFNFFYGMPVHRHAGVFWGAVWTFRMNDLIVPELAFSRNGVRFERLPTRPVMIPLGKKGAWDDAMIFPAARWVEVGDEWWFYYAGWDGPHGKPDARKPGIGLATMTKERLISLRGPRGGGVVITRRLRWPGGKLLLNANAAKGEIQVRVSDATRKPMPGFDYSDCVPLRKDSTAAEIRWKKADIGTLRGETIRLEIYLKNADLFTFRAGGSVDSNGLSRHES